jgi:DNA modification methylase
MTVRLIRGNSLEILPRLELERKVRLVVTSIPYLRQRTYGPDPAELGRETTVADYVAGQVALFRLVRDVMHENGALLLNIGDKANNSGGAGGDWTREQATRKGRRGGSGPGSFYDNTYRKQSFVDAPGAVLRGLLLDGWRLRLPIVWNKGREAAESMAHVNRPRFSHEMIYLLTPGPGRMRFYPSMLKERGSVWTFPPGADPGADEHLAPFPDELAERCILPWSLPGDLILDPFSGSGTVARVADRLGRHAVGIDLYAGDPLELEAAT